MLLINKYNGSNNDNNHQNLFNYKLNENECHEQSNHHQKPMFN